ERRKAGDSHGMVARGEAAQLLDGIFIKLHGAAGGFERANAAARPENFLGIRACKCVAGNFFAAFDAFEKEGIFGAVGEAEMSADGRQQIGRKCVVHRDEVALASEAGKRFEVRLNHFAFYSSVTMVKKLSAFR